MTYFILLQGLTISLNHSMGPACVGYTSEPSENQIPSEVGQDDLFGALEAKLGHVDLIRNILPMLVEYGGPTYIKLFLGDGPTSLCQIRSC